MTKNNNYSIDFINATITITKKFAKNAGTLGTSEFIEMQELRKAYPDFKFEMREIAKNSSKKTYNGLTVFKMIATVEVLEGTAKAKEFRNKISIFENQRSKYALVKKYFLSLFEEGVLDEITPDQEIDIENIVARLEEEKKAKELAEKNAKKNITVLKVENMPEAV